MSADSNDWPYDDSLDALIAAPQFHKLVMENEKVRVLETHIAPGETTPLHTHRWPSVIYTVAADAFLRFDDHGNLLTDSRNLPKGPPAAWVPPMAPHTVQNTGSIPIHLINVEIKNAGPKK
jgi:mannose-6-phosphate isomerase-like protein (cupin superfamily)